MTYKLPPDLIKILATQPVALAAVAGTVISKAGTVTGTAGVGSSLFLQRLLIPAAMSLTEIDFALSIAFPATNQGAGTMSRSFALYSLGNSTSLASVVSASGTSSWNTGTSTAGASTSLTQFQGGWSSPLIQPMTFASSTIAPGEYVVGQLFNFAQASSTWTLNFYGYQAVSTVAASAATNLTSATLGAMSSAGLSSFGSSIRFISAAIATGTALTIGASAAAGALSGMSTVATISLVTNFSTGSYLTASGSVGAVTNVALGALNSTTLAQLTLPNFGFIGTGSTTSNFPTVFQVGIMSTGAIPAAITLTSAAVTISGSAAFQQPWFQLLGN